MSAKDLPVGSWQSDGLYHTAFLFESPQTLATAVYRAAQNSLSRLVGSSDHPVSAAFYFTDPEGNGVELYADHLRSMWPIVDGKIAGDTHSSPHLDSFVRGSIAMGCHELRLT